MEWTEDKSPPDYVLETLRGALFDLEYMKTKEFMVQAGKMLETYLEKKIR